MTPETEDCWQSCDADCEIGATHCIADHLPRHKWRGLSHGDECYRAQRAHEDHAKVAAWDAGYSHCFTFTEGVVSLDDNPYRALLDAAPAGGAEERASPGRMATSRGNGTWTCPICSELIPIQTEVSRRRLGSSIVRFTNQTMADVYAHMWTHEGTQ